MTTSLEPEELRRLLDEAAAGPTTARFDTIFRRAHRRRQVWRGGLVAATVAMVAAAIVVPTLLVSGNATSRPSTAPIGLPSSVRSVSHNPPPAGLRPATSLELFGRWHAVDQPSDALRGYVDFDLHQSWGGSDGCNDFGGRYVVGAGGLFRTSDVASTDVLCSLEAPDLRWVQSARRAEFEGTSLVLLNAKGDVLGRLVRERTAEVIGSFTRVGGSPAASPLALSGDIEVHLNTRTGPVIEHTQAVDGHFDLVVPAGHRYAFTGMSPVINGGRGPGCASFRATSAVAGHTVHVAIDCEIF
jgi:hypothetical protein